MSVTDIRDVVTDVLSEAVELSAERKSALGQKLINALTTRCSLAPPKFTIEPSSLNGVLRINGDASSAASSIASAAATPTDASSAAPSPQIDDRQILEELAQGVGHRLLEKKVKPAEAVRIRRKHIEQMGELNMADLPHVHYDYSEVNGACCENLIGYMPVPVGVVGPLKVNDKQLYVPMATTEGALVASTNRGCKALANGVTTIIFKDAMTRAPLFKFSNLKSMQSCKEWLNDASHFAHVKQVFDDTSRFCRLQKIAAQPEGSRLHLRFEASTGDAMGMNMVTKATEAAVKYIKQFHIFELISLSGNMCTDKKAAAINWINGRGRSVAAEALVPANVVSSVLKSDVASMVRLAQAKLHAGSAMAGAVGGANAQAANVVAAIFIATGQDAAQVVSSSMCSTSLEATDKGDLHVTCTMNCLEVGTVGGGTILAPQKAALRMLDCEGPNASRPGENARRFAQIVAATVLAGELSLLASQCSGDLVRSHMTFNRSSRDLAKSASRDAPAASPVARTTAATAAKLLPATRATAQTTRAENGHIKLIVNDASRLIHRVKKGGCDNIL